MRTETIKEAVKEAERFIKRAKECIKVRSKPYWNHQGQDFFPSAPKESGSTRRASMDLTRKLAEMRKA